MRMTHDEFEKWYMLKINAAIRKMPEYKVGMEVINVGGGVDLQVNGEYNSDPILRGMLAMAHEEVKGEIEQRLESIARRIKN